ncbi:hypothetical protein [Algoriella sp.]|uniref:hypothetical protein n=1 Tax=Algoriella sp. TaxID=1872434 RepID=UPI001B2D1DF8|nr:hypothetical protein [Algoriella sp.]MBO6212442.1 hypothetical protein [Algoriella sp.]
MKINQSILILITVLISTFSFAQISTTRMNELKIGMRPNEVMKFYGKKPAAIVDDYKKIITINGVNFTFSIGKGYLSKTENDSYLNSISTTSKNIKTLSGIGIGSTLDDLWKAYGAKYDIYLNKAEFDSREFRIQDAENATLLLFELKNEIVTEIILNSYNPEECTI